jgi:hypothetical protein
MIAEAESDAQPDDPEKHESKKSDRKEVDEKHCGK